MKANIYSFKNSVDPDQLTSEESLEKPSDQDPHCFLYNEFIIIDLTMDLDWLKIRQHHPGL